MPPVQKRKRRVLTIKEKLESCELLKTQTYGEIARKYGIGESTIYVIKKQETRRERPKSAPYLRLKNIQGTTIGKIWKKNFFFKKKF